jgi:hypothetical protein
LTYYEFLRIQSWKIMPCSVTMEITANVPLFSWRSNMGLFDGVRSFFQGAEETAPAIKPERNAPCWCGSGKKYKKCHLIEEEKKAAAKACSLNCGPT